MSLKQLALGTLAFAAMNVAFPSCVDAQPAPKLEPDEMFWASKNDPDMNAAMDAARATLPEFLALARAPRRDTRVFAIKVRITDGLHVEYFWLSPFAEQNGLFSGTVDNEPDTVKTVKLGEQITFTHNDIVDWTYVDGRGMRGNYTLCASFKRRPRPEAEALIAKYGMDCKL